MFGPRRDLPVSVRPLEPRGGHRDPARPLLLIIACVIGASGTAYAQASATKAATSVQAQAPAGAGSSGAASERRDPKGIRGISPYAEGLARGDALFVARDYEGALAQYRATIALAPSEPSGHLRAFEVDFTQKRYEAAEESLAAAERFGGNDPRVRLSVLHFRSLVLEAKGSLDQALIAWENVEKQATNPDAPSPSLVIVAIERRKVIQARLDVVKSSSQVKARVEKAESVTPAK